MLVELSQSFKGVASIKIALPVGALNIIRCFLKCTLRVD
jgi:hypothetical protein